MTILFLPDCISVFYWVIFHILLSQQFNLSQYAFLQPPTKVPYNPSKHAKIRRLKRLMAVIPKGDGSGTKEVAVKLRGAGIEFPSITSVGSGGGGHPGEAGNNPEWSILSQHPPNSVVCCTICHEGTAAATWEDPLVPGNQAVVHSCLDCQKKCFDVNQNGWCVVSSLSLFILNRIHHSDFVIGAAFSHSPCSAHVV